jgi:DNA-directed RNA polymerase specialized sigma24 family protein
MSRAVLTPEAFEKLLRWLGPEHDKAGEKYEKIRLRLIRIFSCRGCCDPEDLTDETFNVVATKIDWLLENYNGDPALYFYGVAKKVYLEHLKRKPLPEPPPLPDKSEIEQKCNCLERCVQKELTEPDRKLVFRYHEKEKGEKIRVRKQIAKELGISINALRIRVYHLHSRLRPCIEQCLRHLLEQ